MSVFKDVFGKERWSDLDTGCDFTDSHSAQTILEHLEKKYHKERPVDIEEEKKTLNSLPDQSGPLEKYFSKLQKIQKKFNPSKEHVLDVMLKHIAHGHLLKMSHLQLYVNKWDNNQDPTGNKMYTKMQDYFIQKDLDTHANKTALSIMGIASTAVEFQDDCISRILVSIKHIAENQVALGNTVNQLQTGKESL